MQTYTVIMHKRKENEENTKKSYATVSLYIMAFEVHAADHFISTGIPLCSRHEMFLQR